MGLVRAEEARLGYALQGSSIGSQRLCPSAPLIGGLLLGLMKFPIPAN